MNEAFTRGFLSRLVHRRAHAFAIDRIAVEIADDHEHGLGGKSAVLARIIDQIIALRRVDVVGEQTNFVVVSMAVAIFRAVRIPAALDASQVDVARTGLRPSAAGTLIGTSQWLFDESRNTARSSSS